MKTFVQLDKYAQKWFADEMRHRGFAVEKRFTFWRKRGPLYDMFIPQILGGGDLLRIRVSIWSPWADTVDGQFDKFPPEYCLIGGTISNKFPIAMHDDEQFWIQSEEVAGEQLKLLLAMIDKHVLPWFPTVNSYETFARYIGVRGDLTTAKYQAQLKTKMARGFELKLFD